MERGLAGETQRRATRRPRGPARGRRRRTGAPPGRSRPASPRRAPWPTSRPAAQQVEGLGRVAVGRDDVAEHQRAVRRQQQAAGRPPRQLAERLGTSPGWLGAWPSTTSGRPCWIARNAWCRSTSARRTSSPSCAASVSAASRSAWARSTSPAEASSQPASEQRLGRQARRPASRRGRPGSAAAPAVPSPSTTQVQPKPTAIRAPSCGVVRGAPGQGGVDVGPLGAREREALGLLAGHGRARRTTSARSAYQSACAAPAPPRPARPRRGARRRRSGCCRAAGSARHRRSGSRRVTRERSTSRATVSRTAPAGTSSAASTCSAASSEAPPAKHDSAHSPRWSSGNSRS